MTAGTTWANVAEGDEREAATQVASGLFGGAAWANVLEGLGCKAVRVRHLPLQLQLVVPVFRRGPLRIGFLGFPIAGGAFDGLSAGEFDRYATDLAKHLDLDIVRGVRCRRTEREAGDCNPEVWVDDLSTWPGSLGKRIARDLAFAQRACAHLQITESGGSPEAWHALYAGAVRAHGGNLRYTPEYFRRLSQAATSGAGARIFHASDVGGRTLGFAVLAMHLDSGYYLHGAVDPSMRKSGLSDLLLWNVITRARDEGMRSFSLMASPPSQEGLVRFKSKWAERQGWTVTRDVGATLVGRMALAARRIAQLAQRRMTGRG